MQEETAPRSLYILIEKLVMQLDAQELEQLKETIEKLQMQEE